MPFAVVTGANRGLGRETARQLAAAGWSVAITARRLAAAEEAADALRADAPAGILLLPAALDVTDTGQAAALADLVRERFGGLDALVNNAGALFGGTGDGSALTADPAALIAAFETNTVGPLNATRALAPLLLASGGGNVVNVSSGMGSVSEMGGGSAPYRLSKAALNALTRVLHAELSGRGVRVNSVCPGWVRTDMGGAGASRSVEEGARGIVWAATLDASGPSGGFFRDGAPIAF